MQTIVSHHSSAAAGGSGSSSSSACDICEKLLTNTTLCSEKNTSPCVFFYNF